VGKRSDSGNGDFGEPLDVHHQDAQHGESAQQVERQDALAFHNRAGRRGRYGEVSL